MGHGVVHSGLGPLRLLQVDQRGQHRGELAGLRRRADRVRELLVGARDRLHKRGGPTDTRSRPPSTGGTGEGRSGHGHRGHLPGPRYRGRPRRDRLNSPELSLSAHQLTGTCVRSQGFSIDRLLPAHTRLKRPYVPHPRIDIAADTRRGSTHMQIPRPVAHENRAHPPPLVPIPSPSSAPSAISRPPTQTKPHPHPSADSPDWNGDTVIITHPPPKRGQPACPPDAPDVPASAPHPPPHTRPRPRQDRRPVPRTLPHTRGNPVPRPEGG